MTPIARFQALQAELTPIQDKQSVDDKWFEVGSNGKLFLRNKPYDGRRMDTSFCSRVLNCLNKVKECLRRLFSNPYPILEKKIQSLTQQINEYLTLEDDPKRRSEFLDQYGPAVSQLIDSAAKLHLLKASAIAPSAPIRQWMLAEVPKFGLQALQTEVFFTAQNLNPKYPVTFDFREGKNDAVVLGKGVAGWEDALRKPISAKDDPIHSRFTKTLEEDWTLSAKVHHKEKMDVGSSKSFSIVIKPNGEVTYKQSEVMMGSSNCVPATDWKTENSVYVLIENKSHFNLSIDLQGYTNEANTKPLKSRQTTVPAHDKRSMLFPTKIPLYEKKQAAWSRHIEETYSSKIKSPQPEGTLHCLEFDIHGTQSKQMKFGCKTGQYKATMGTDGKLDVGVTALRVIQGVSQEKHVVKSTQTLATTYNHPGDVSTVAVFNEFQIANGPNWRIVNQFKNLLDVEVSVKPTGNGNKPFTPSFTVSELMIPGHQQRTWPFLTLEEKAKGGWIKEAVAKIEQQGEAEFSISIRELATE